MSAKTKSFITEAEYLELERKAATKSEYYNGEIFAMAGASFNHNAVTGALLGELYAFLKGKSCKVFPSDLRVHNYQSTLFTYPDASIVCGKAEFIDTNSDTLLNPTVLFEVLSPSTSSYDRGDKFMLYRSIPSLQNYVLISSMEVLAEVYTRRNDDEWVLNVTQELAESIHISAIGFDLPLRDVYRQAEELTSGNTTNEE